MSIFRMLSGLLIICFATLNSTGQEQEKIVAEYISALNSSDFKKIDELISDKVCTSEGDMIVADSREAFYRIFQWDSVFSPQFELIEIQPIDQESQEIVLSKICRRIEFLHDSAIVCKVIFTFKDDKISKISTVDYPVFDLEKWNSRRNSLISWVDENEPELSGYIFDQSIQGGINYLIAIDLYRNRE